MPYVIPALIPLNKRSLSNNEEVNIIRQVEEKKGNNVRLITPFYYQVFVKSVCDSYTILLDPLNDNVIKLNYRLPDLETIYLKLESTG